MIFLNFKNLKKMSSLINNNINYCCDYCGIQTTGESSVFYGKNVCSNCNYILTKDSYCKGCCNKNLFAESFLTKDRKIDWLPLELNIERDSKLKNSYYYLMYDYCKKCAVFRLGQYFRFRDLSFKKFPPVEYSGELEKCDICHLIEMTKPFCPPTKGAVYWDNLPPCRPIPPIGNGNEKICYNCQVDLVNKQM